MARATLESTQHYFLGTQKGKHLLRESNQMFLEKESETLFVSQRQKTFYPQQNLFRVRAKGKECDVSVNNVSSFVGAEIDTIAL